MARLANALVVSYEDLTAAAGAVGLLQDAAYDLDKVSVAALETSPDIGGSEGWGSPGIEASLWGVLAHWASFDLPGIGPVLVAGPLVGWLVAILNDTSLFGGLTALGVACYSLGLSTETATAGEEWVRQGRCLLLVHGSSAEIDQARNALNPPAARKASESPGDREPGAGSYHERAHQRATS